MISTDIHLDKQEGKEKLLDGWRMVRFGEVACNVDITEHNPLANGLERYVGLDHIDPESLHIKRWGLIEEGTSFTRKFVKGQVLFGKRRAYQRKVAIADFDGICSGDILVFEVKNDLLPELLPFIVQSDGFYEHALSTSAGSLSPRTKWKDLAAYEFALPPEDDQRRIADILWAAKQNILTSEQVVQSAIETKKALLAHLLHFGIYKPSSEINLELKETEIGTIPGNWDVATLNEVCDVIVDCPHTTPHFLSSGVLVIRNFNVLNGQLILNPEFYTSEEEYRERNRRCEPQEGDILFSREAPIGEACVIPPNTRLSLGQRMMLIRCNLSMLNNFFLVNILYHSSIKSRILALAGGTTAKHLNVKDVRNLKIPLPPLDEQHNITKILWFADEAINIGQKKVQEAKTLNDSLIKTLLI